MKLNVLAVAFAASAMSAFSASAHVMIEERRDPPAVIERDKPDASVTIEKRDGVFGIEKKTITKETTGSGDCSPKTVHKDDVTRSKTPQKTNCD